MITFISLALAAYFDWKQRWIPDKIWVFQLSLSVILLVIWFSLGQPLFTITLVLVNIVMGFLLALVIIFTGAMAGGDVKGFFSTSLSFPLFVSPIDPILQLPHVFPALFSLLLNFFLLYVVLALGIFTYNYVRILRGERIFAGIQGSLSQKVKLLFEGIIVNTDGIEKLQFYNPGEVYTEGNWQLYTPSFEGMMTDDEFDELEQEERREMLKSIEETNKQQIWVRPQIPGLVILFISYLLTLTIGTPLSPLLSFITSFP